MITDLAQYRMARQRPILDALRWHQAFEIIAVTNLRIMFAWQRILWRF